MTVGTVLYEVSNMLENVFKKYVSKMAEAKAEPEDYTGDDGLLYCGKCHTPKQTRLDFNPVSMEMETTVVAVRCRCQTLEDEAERLRIRRNQFIGRMNRLREDDISSPDGLKFSFEDDDRKNPKISDTCRRYVECWEEMLENNIGILFYGSVRTGKSFLASCVGNALLEREVSVAATNFPRLLNLLQGTYEKQQLLDRLSLYKLLVLDDLGVERDSPYALEQIFNIVDARANSKMPVIVTTNLTMEELENPSNMQYARIYERVLEMCPIHLKMAGESRRKSSAAERERLARKILLGQQTEKGDGNEFNNITGR